MIAACMGSPPRLPPPLLAVQQGRAPRLVAMRQRACNWPVQAIYRHRATVAATGDAKAPLSGTSAAPLLLDAASLLRARAKKRPAARRAGSASAVPRLLGSKPCCFGSLGEP